MSRQLLSVATGRRGQLVLVAAAAIAIALVPVSLAYLQLGYHADIDAMTTDSSPGQNAKRVLQHAVHNASGAVDGEYTWADRHDALVKFETALLPTLDRLQRSRLSAGVGYTITRNQTAATAWARTNCPSGPMQQFGSCRARDGVVLQERAGETAILSVAFDVHIVEERGTMNQTVVVTAIGGGTPLSG